MPDHFPLPSYETSYKRRAVVVTTTTEANVWKLKGRKIEEPEREGTLVGKKDGGLYFFGCKIYFHILIF